jgi:hypothetical protein
MVSTFCAQNTIAPTWLSGRRHPSPSADSSVEQKLQGYHHNGWHSCRQFVIHFLPCAQGTVREEESEKVVEMTGLGWFDSKVTGLSQWRDECLGSVSTV